MREGTVEESEQLRIFKGIVTQQGSGNTHCADCNAKSPTWCSLDLGVFVCLDCSGGHRRLGPTVSRIRSYMIDAWKYSDIEVFTQTGNAKVNEYYEAKLLGSTQRRTIKPTPDASVEEKAAFVHSKYLDKEYVLDTSKLSPSQIFFRQANKINPNNRTKDNAGYQMSSNQSENKVQNNNLNKYKESQSNQIKKITVPQTVSDVWDMSAFMSKGTNNNSNNSNNNNNNNNNNISNGNGNIRKSEKQGFNSVNNDQCKSKSTQPNPFDENFMNSFKSVDNNPFVQSQFYNNKSQSKPQMSMKQPFQVATYQTQQEQENNGNTNSNLSLNSNQININTSKQITQQKQRQQKDKSSEKSWEKQFAEFGSFSSSSSKQQSQNANTADPFNGFFTQSYQPADQQKQQQQQLGQQQIIQDNQHQQEQIYQYPQQQQQQQQQFSQEIIQQNQQQQLPQPQQFLSQPQQQSYSSTNQQSVYPSQVQFPTAQASSGGIQQQSWQNQSYQQQPCYNPWDNNSSAVSQLPQAQILQPSVQFQQNSRQQQPYAQQQQQQQQQYQTQMWNNSSNSPVWDANQQYQNSINAPQYQQQPWQQQQQTSQQQQFQLQLNAQQQQWSQQGNQQIPTNISPQQYQVIQPVQYSNTPQINNNNNNKTQAGSSTTSVNLLDLF